MNITLESIQFRIAGANNGAFNVSVAVNEAGDRRIVTGPEWLRGERQAAAFAARAASPFIDVTLLCSEAGPVQARLQAVAVNAHVLGDIAARDIVFQNGRWTGRIDLPAARIAAVGKHAIQWHWQVGAGAQNFAVFTEHDIYTVLGEPSGPWEVAGTDASAAPWQEALDAACGWARGATSREGVLNAIANHHYRSGLLRYGTPRYVEEGIFKIAEFLKHQSQGGVNEVDCADCATIGATFGELLGAACRIAVLDTVPETDFFPAATNVLIGGVTDAPGFNQHETVWNIEDPAAARVWDFCLGRRNDDAAEPYTDARFTNPEKPATAYPVRAFIPVTAQNLTAVSFPLRQVKRTAQILNLRQPDDPARFGFSTWNNRARDFKGLAFLNFVPRALLEMLPVETYRYQQQPKPWLVESLYRFGDETLQVSVFECESREDAHLALFHLLAERRVKPVLKLLPAPIGDVLFYDEDEESDVLLFGRGNLAFRLQRNRGDHKSLLELARLTDSLLTRGLTAAPGLAATAADIVREMSFPVPRETDESVRFFSETAEIVFSGMTAMVRNGAEGIHTVAVDHRQADSLRSTVINFLHPRS